MPDFQDQIAAAGLLQQPDRWVGVDLDEPDRFRISADIREHVHGGDAESKRAGGLPGQRQRGLGARRFEHHRSPRAQIHPAGNVPALALGQHDVERSIATRRQGNRRKAVRPQAFIVCDQEIADRALAVAQHGWRVFARGIDHFTVQQKHPVFAP